MSEASARRMYGHQPAEQADHADVRSKAKDLLKRGLITQHQHDAMLAGKH